MPADRRRRTVACRVLDGAVMNFAYFAFTLFSVGCAADAAVDDDGFRAGAKADDPYGWSHVVLHSDDGIGVSVDYVSHYRESHEYKPTNVDWADPVYANVWSDKLTGNESVRVVF